MAASGLAGEVAGRRRRMLAGSPNLPRCRRCASAVQGETPNTFRVVEILLNSKRTVRRKNLQLNARD